MRVVIAGGAGALGRRLAGFLEDRGDVVTILTRSPRKDLAFRQVAWDGRSVGSWYSELERAVVINLAGELVDVRPTARNVVGLQRSRVEPTRALVEAASRVAVRPPLWLQMSTTAIYGDAGDDLVDERHPVADSPPQMPGVARRWEEAVHGAPTDRLVIMRTGLVLDRGTPAYERLRHITRAGLGGRIGRGRQWVSWIHVEDFLRAVAFLAERECELDGVVHVTAPNPIRNRDMMGALRAAFDRRWTPPTPEALVRLGAFALGTDAALALLGRRAVPRRLLDAGFKFAYPNFDEAIRELVSAPAVTPGRKGDRLPRRATATSTPGPRGERRGTPT